jgi:hypothetical protein
MHIKMIMINYSIMSDYYSFHFLGFIRFILDRRFSSIGIRNTKIAFQKSACEKPMDATGYTVV